ncbi:MAG: hypothetical protein J5529_07750 [Prevotella sp.]|nr:hypothetical protein [Prevotella sp.]
MKKFTLFALAALMVSATSLAQRPLRPLSKDLPAPKAANGKVIKSQPPKASQQKQIDAERLKSTRMAFSMKKNQSKLTKQSLDSKDVQLKPARVLGNDFEMITKTPEGTLINCVREGSAYYVYFIYVTSTTFDNMVGTVVFGPNNEVYIKDIISQAGLGTWVKGTINGSKITIDFPQKVYVLDGDELFADLLTYDAEEQWFASAKGSHSVTLNYNATTNTISCPLMSDLSNGYSIIGLVYGDGEWAGYGDWDIYFKPLTDEPVVAPEGMETTQYSVSAKGYSGGLANVGFDGNDIYIQGIYSGMPEGWVKGTIEGDKAIFKSGQYMGPDYNTNFHQYLVSATAEEVWDDWYEEWYTEYSLAEGDIVFDYDPETKTLSNSTTFLINAGTTDVYYSAAYDKATLKPFVEVAATPATPTDFYVEEPDVDYYLYGYGWGTLQFELPCSDANGEYILPEKLSYVFYTRVNGEEKELTLSADDYIYLDEDMTEIPYDFSDNWDIMALGTTHYTYYYCVGAEAYGVQAIYRGAGEERRSEIVWYEMEGLGSEVQPAAATPAYPDIDPSDVGSSISYGFFTGDEDVYVFGELRPETYDVAMKLSDPALVGTYIESITIPMMEVRGVSGISAWISSQLRIEDGKNVPDLASVSVTPDEAGFINVKLDKPYIIPEEGVYVGYTFTIDDTSFEDNLSPIAIIEEKSDEGFYLHTSAGFMKWLNLSDLFGVNAAIQVTLGGSKVKANAVATSEGEEAYVLANAPFDIQLDLTNHGANGAQSIDVEYTVASQNGTQHIDLAEPVEGFFGKAFVTTINLPAIAEIGSYELNVKVSKVNGADNEDASASTTIPVNVMNWVPTHKTLIEEYTGTWCGWCTRGLVALEKLAELYPNDFVRISYHNGDPMEIMGSSFFPNVVTGFPDAWIDRKIEVDPYYGTGNDDFGVVSDLQARATQFAYATIDFTAVLSEDGENVDVNAEVSFPFDITEGKYAIEYVLVSDGLTGEGSDWNQSNYYAGGGYGEMGGFEALESSIPGLVFNDVAILVSEIGGLKGSIPANVKAEDVVKHSYSFKLSDAVNTSAENIIQDNSKLRVVGLLIDQSTGEVLNANSVPVSVNTSISEVDGNNGKVVGVTFYDLGGRRLNKAQQGVNIMEVTYSDGTKKAIKIFK